MLLTGYASPDRIRRVGHTRLAGWLRHRKVRGYASIAAPAVEAAKAQSITLPGQDLATTIVAELAASILTLDDRLRTLDAQIEQTFKQHPQATIIQSMPGFGPFLGAALLVGAGDLRAFPSASHLAAAAGLVPFPTIPAAEPATCTVRTDTAVRYGRCYLSAQTSMMRAGPNRDYYLKKRAHGTLTTRP